MFMEVKIEFLTCIADTDDADENNFSLGFTLKYFF